MMREAANLASAWAPAKINLYLEVGRPKPDGRHPLDSFVMFADTHAADRVSARPSNDVTIALSGPGAPALKNQADNLVLRAAHALRHAAGLRGVGAALSLRKSLPTAAGVGGGSADAAATLRVLNQFWEVGFGDDALAVLGADLGADVPACVHSAPARMYGTGETLARAAAPDLPAVLVNPGVQLSTAAVFKRFDKQGGGAKFKETPPPSFKPDAPIAGFVKAISARRNDLEAPATVLASAISQAKAALAEQDGVLLARMSGSGATCFGIFESDDAAKAAAEAIADTRPKWWVCATQLRGGAL